MAHESLILELRPLGFPWVTFDPFLFCVHHDDAYPVGNGKMGPLASLAGRMIGQDFEAKDGWRMYHGAEVPGFPVHPHRGFETVTIVRQGFIDHFDSLGATARYGAGDVQWLTAASGIQHSEMFPLLHVDRPNPVELFQIWLNLPRASKFATPHFSMFWRDRIPILETRDTAGKQSRVTLVAGALEHLTPLASPPSSWASNASNDVAIWLVQMEPQANWNMPRAQEGSNRAIYFFKGNTLKLGAESLSAGLVARLRPDSPVNLVNGDAPAEILVLQGKPIGEPVVQHGPFVMNSPAEIRQAFLDYQRTQFGGWSWEKTDPVHPADASRFAIHADGTKDVP